MSLLARRLDRTGETSCRLGSRLGDLSLEYRSKRSEEHDLERLLSLDLEDEEDFERERKLRPLGTGDRWFEGDLSLDLCVLKRVREREGESLVGGMKSCCVLLVVGLEPSSL